MLMDQYGEEVYADLRQFYGVHPTDLPPAEILALVRQLPSSSRFMAVRPETAEYFQWDRQATMLADMFDQLSHLIVTTVKVQAGKKGKKIPDPVPYPRPGSKKKRKKSNHLLASLRTGKTVDPFADDSKVVRLH